MSLATFPGVRGISRRSQCRIRVFPLVTFDFEIKIKNSNQLVRFVAALILASVAASASLIVRSYTYSDHLTYSDVELSTDEGLFSIMIPLARLAPGHKAYNDWRTYTRHRIDEWTTDRWVTAAGGTKFRAREYFAMLGQAGNDDTISTGIFMGFGYVFVDSTLTSASRPGPLVWIVVPIWAVAAISTAAIGALLCMRARFGIRSLLLLTAIAAVILLLPTLQASP